MKGEENRAELFLNVAQMVQGSKTGYGANWYTGVQGSKGLRRLPKNTGDRLCVLRKDWQTLAYESKPAVALQFFADCKFAGR